MTLLSTAHASGASVQVIHQKGEDDSLGGLSKRVTIILDEFTIFNVKVLKNGMMGSITYARYQL